MSTVNMTFTLYSYFRSSCSWRVRLALNLLKIPHTIEPINLLKNEQLSAEYKHINPLGTVPAVMNGNNQIIWQSLAIIDHIDPEQTLLPKDPMARARCWQISHTVCSEIQPLQNLAVTKRIGELAGDAAKTEWAVFHNKSKLKIINDHLVEEGSSYCVGDDITLADVCVVPQLYSAHRFGIDIRTAFPKLFAIAKRLEKNPAFKDAHPHSQADCPADIRALGIEF